MTSDQLDEYLDQVAALSGVDMVFFEGGEPFTEYDLLLAGIQGALKRGLRWGVVSNGDWARQEQTARQVLRELKEHHIASLTLSTDSYHSRPFPSEAIRNAVTGAREMGIPTTVLATQGPGSCTKAPDEGLGDLAWSQVMYRGRAAHALAASSESTQKGQEYTACGHEQLDTPSRVHLDAFGYVHLCQGLALGRLGSGENLADLIANYQPKFHPIAGPLLAGGPRALALAYAPDTLEQEFCDSCHMCYSLRLRLRHRFPHLLGPPHVYGLS